VPNLSLQVEGGASATVLVELLRLFLQKQIEIVRPLALVALGVNAERFVSRLDLPWIESLHPTDWYFRETNTRQQRLKAQGAFIAKFLCS